MEKRETEVRRQMRGDLVERTDVGRGEGVQRMAAGAVFLL